MSASPEVTACLLVIGNEILSGRTKDANLPYLAGRLNEWGVRLREARVIPDDEAVIVAAINECRAKFDYLFSTGGIGPTHDDITAAAVAKAFGLPLVRDPEAVARLQARYGGTDLNEARLKMADIPAGAELIENPVSGAPGFRVENVFVMAGVPAIMRAMVESVRHRLTGGEPVRSRSVAAHLAEGTVAEGLAAIQARYPDLDIGSYPFYRHGNFGVSLVLRGVDDARLDAALAELEALIVALGAEPIGEVA